MSDIIQVLPDSVANQIAAGEVIQRPASAVKEMLENALDAGAETINLIIKDGGKTLIQVVDDGSGMSDTDARLSFERHATSKIKSVEDLFAIKTMGFRGEALASIAAIAQVELKTRKRGTEIGSELQIEGSEVKYQEPVSCPEGSSLSVKNLFYNVPARRNFLKSNPVETKHIIDEFQRVAIANPHVAFSMFHNGLEVFRLPKGNLRQRIVAVFGANYNERLVPVDEETSIIGVKGFIGKPEFAKKTRGEQFFFVNGRFVKDGYLNHAVVNAFEGMLPPGSFPTYFLFIDIDPARIDINIHPTKTEIKFDDDRSIYAIMRAAVKKSLGQFSITPSLDFERETAFDVPVLKSNKLPQQPKININPGFNPFRSHEKNVLEKDKNAVLNWEKLYEGLERNPSQLIQQEHQINQEILIPESEIDVEEISKKNIFQLAGKYIVSAVKSGLMVINQQAAHERIIFEQYIATAQENKTPAQQKLFPKSIELSTSDFILLKEIEPYLQMIGFEVREFGLNTIVVDGIPADMEGMDETEAIEGILEQYKNNADLPGLDIKEKLIRAVAGKLSIRQGQKLDQMEMISIIDRLFACANPYYSPSGTATVTMISIDELNNKFEK
ncbi:MAG: DNA mismatch repair endonuclease MutL [Bacteroidia bacterium]